MSLFRRSIIAARKQSQPITYLTNWKIVGNSEVHTLPYPDGVVLPNGYKRCEYLTFDGNSYINTEVMTANDIGYNFKCKTIATKTLIGGRGGSSYGFIIGYFQNNKLAAAYGGATSTTVATVNNYNDNGVHHIILDSVKLQIDDEVVDISSLRTTANIFFNIYLGTWNNGGSADNRMWTSDIYDTIIYNTQGELWHGIPCLDANDVPCFYDIVSQTAFYNQGSGSFTYKLYPQPTEIWSCGEYSEIDNKYHILVQPLGGSIADIALTEPLRKVNDVADTIEFPSNTDGKALVTRALINIDLGSLQYQWKTLSASYTAYMLMNNTDFGIKTPNNNDRTVDIVCPIYTSKSYRALFTGADTGIGLTMSGEIRLRDSNYDFADGKEAFVSHLQGIEALFILATTTTELVDAPQIAEADSYTCEISQGGKAVSWSSFTTESE